MQVERFMYRLPVSFDLIFFSAKAERATCEVRQIVLKLVRMRYEMGIFEKLVDICI